MSLIDRGSYGKIFLQQDNTIVKELVLFDKENVLCPSTLRELNMYGLLSNYSEECIIKLIRVHFKTDKVYLIMENGGQTLTRWVLSEKVKDTSHSIFMNLFKKMIKTLYFINKLGYVHGDIKPDNIVIDHKNNPRLIDFGASIPIGKLTSYCLCTDAFRDPSLKAKDCIYNDKSDLFSLSLVLGYFISKKYFIYDGEYYYHKYINTIEHSHLNNDTKILLMRMAHPHYEERPSFLELANFFSIDSQNLIKFIDFKEKIPVLPQFTVTHIEKCLNLLKHVEYIDDCFEMMKRLGLNYQLKIHSTISFLLCLAYYERLTVNISSINLFLPLSYTIGELKSKIIDFLQAIHLILYEVKNEENKTE
jgi:serine/threonine protein kinase